MKANSSQPWYLWAIMAAFVCYAAGYIYCTSFVIDGERCFMLFDDAMISMRYGKNLATGDGLVWNPGGERVEGYTNLLWVVFMAGLHYLPIDDFKISLVVQVSAIGILLANLWYVNKLALLLSNGSRMAASAALLLTAFYLPLNTWSLQGMEVSVGALIVTLAAWLALDGLERQSFRFALLYGLLGTSTLLRLDLAVPMLVITGYLALIDRPRRTQHIAWGLGTLLLFLGGQTLGRWLYYGDLLPNTYYLKMTGYPILLRMTRGLAVFGKFLWSLKWTVVFAGALFVVCRSAPRRAALLILLAGGQGAYSIYVGGDAWEWFGGANRYLCVAMPVVCVLLGSAVATLGQYLSERLRLPVWASPLAQAGLILFAVLALNGADSRPALRRLALLSVPLHCQDNVNLVEDSRSLNQLTTPEAKIVVAWAGAPAYFTNRQMIDLLGKCDRTIAHLPMHQAEEPKLITQLTWFYPGHLKWSYDHTFVRLEPDVIYNLWKHPEEIQSYLDENYVPLKLSTGQEIWLRRGSSRVLWEQVPKVAQRPALGSG